MRLQPHPIPTTRFSASKIDKQMVAEVSDLPFFRLSPLYDDACDIGISLFNPKTGKTIVFVFTETDTDGEDIYGWNFVPCPEDLRANPELEGWKVLVIND